MVPLAIDRGAEEVGSGVYARSIYVVVLCVFAHLVAVLSSNRPVKPNQYSALVNMEDRVPHTEGILRLEVKGARTLEGLKNSV
jgi:hypothetical protein